MKDDTTSSDCAEDQLTVHLKRLVSLQQDVRVRDLAIAVHDWRNTLLSRGISSRAILYKVQEWVLEQMDERIRSGQTVEQAFQSAIRLLAHSTVIEKDPEVGRFSGTLRDLPLTLTIHPPTVCPFCGLESKDFVLTAQHARTCPNRPAPVPNNLMP